MSHQNFETHASEITPENLKDNYAYLHLLGEGSNGRTWLAQSYETGLEVAIKELKDIQGFKQYELFRREAEVLGSIEIKGIPALYNTIYSDDGACYLIEEYIPYPSLQNLLDKETTFNEPLVIQIMKSVTAILEQLETKYTPPIVHRDIKPSNILFTTRADGEIEVYLIDFGAVTNTIKRDEGSTIAGTYGYMAPEQFQGKADIRSDYYALGATALHLLSHQSPCNMETNGVFELDFERYLPATTSQGMKDLLHHLLSPQAENRPSDAQALMEALDRALRPSTQAILPIRCLKWLMNKLFSPSESLIKIDETDKQQAFEKLLKQINRNKFTWEKTKSHIEEVKINKNREEVILTHYYSVNNILYEGFISLELNSDIKKRIIKDNTSPNANTCVIEYAKEAPYLSINLSETIALKENYYNYIHSSYYNKATSSKYIENYTPFNHKRFHAGDIIDTPQDYTIPLLGKIILLYSESVANPSDILLLKITKYHIMFLNALYIYLKNDQSLSFNLFQHKTVLIMSDLSMRHYHTLPFLLEDRSNTYKSITDIQTYCNIISPIQLLLNTLKRETESYYFYNTDHCGNDNESVHHFNNVIKIVHQLYDSLLNLILYLLSQVSLHKFSQNSQEIMERIQEILADAPNDSNRLDFLYLYEESVKTLTNNMKAIGDCLVQEVTTLLDSNDDAYQITDQQNCYLSKTDARRLLVKYNDNQSHIDSIYASLGHLSADNCTEIIHKLKTYWAWINSYGHEIIDHLIIV